jgi:hypothetical protein
MSELDYEADFVTGRGKADGTFPRFRGVTEPNGCPKLRDANHRVALPYAGDVICNTCDGAHSHSHFPLRNFGHINRQISGVVHSLHAFLRFAGAVM